MENNKSELISLGNKIKELRENLGLTQEELGKLVGYTSRSSINKVENGDVDLPRSKIIAFAKALKTSPAYLMGWGEENINLFERLQQENRQNISEDEERVLKIARGASELDNKTQKALLSMIEALKKDEGKNSGFDDEEGL